MLEFILCVIAIFFLGYLTTIVRDYLAERRRWNGGTCATCNATFARLGKDGDDGARRYICGCPKLVTHISWPVDR